MMSACRGPRFCTAGIIQDARDIGNSSRLPSCSAAMTRIFAIKANPTAAHRARGGKQDANPADRCTRGWTIAPRTGIIGHRIKAKTRSGRNCNETTIQVAGIGADRGGRFCSRRRRHVHCIRRAGAGARRQADCDRLGQSLTGALSPNGKQALLGAEIWRDQVNKAGGLLGRPVELKYYDDKSDPSEVPGIYTKLLDVDKVDLVVSGYATNQIAPAMPVVIRKGKAFISLFGLDVNGQVQIPEVFLDHSDRSGHQGLVHQGLLRYCRGADPEAEDRGADHGRRRVLAERL